MRLPPSRLACALLLILPLAGCLESADAPPSGAAPPAGSPAAASPAPAADSPSLPAEPGAILTPPAASTPPSTQPAPTPATPPATEPAPTPAGEGAAAPSFRSLAAGQWSGYAEEGRLVLETEREWVGFWERHAAPFSPPPERPEVDFTRERVVAVTLGPKSDTCWHVRVASVREDASAGALEVGVTVYGPATDALCGAAGTQPFHAVAVPRSPGPVAFSETQRQGPPGSGDSL